MLKNLFNDYVATEKKQFLPADLSKDSICAFLVNSLTCSVNTVMNCLGDMNAFSSISFVPVLKYADSRKWVKKA